METTCPSPRVGLSAIQHGELIERQLRQAGVGLPGQRLGRTLAMAPAVVVVPLEPGQRRLREQPPGFLDDPALARRKVAAEGVGVAGQPGGDGELDVGVQFRPKVTGTFTCDHYEVRTPGGNTVPIECSGEAVGPELVLSKEVINFNDVIIQLPRQSSSR